MNKQQHFSFASTKFKKEVAHAGGEPILTCRVLGGLGNHPYNFLDLSIVPPGATIGVHTHEQDNEELYVVVSGRGRMYLDGSEFEVVAGDVVVNRPGGTHGLRNTGDEALRLVVLEIPSVRPKSGGE